MILAIIKKYRRYILSFFIPFLAFLIFFALKGCFTGKNILNSDMQGQYVSLFQYLRNVLHGDASFPYTFSKGLGGAMYGAYFYYLANPLNLLVYFFEDIPRFLMFLVIFKISLSGLTMFCFLKYKFKEENNAILIFSIAYALMNYNINYYLNLMWLDGVLLAPLLLLGIERMVHKKGNALYIITLFIAIYMNYYIGYILTFFSVFYFLYVFFNTYQKEWKQEYKLILNFFIVTFLTGLMTTFILLPCGLELLNAARVDVSSSKWINLNFLDFIAPNYIGFGTLTNPLNYYNFCIFSGTVMLPLVICYFTNSKIPKREKILSSVMYLLFLLPIIFPFLNRLWHMFTMPTAFNYRYSFLVTLFTIMISYRSFQQIAPSKKVVGIYFSLFIILSCSLGYVTILTPEYYVCLDIYKVIVTVILVGINLILLIKRKKMWILTLLVFELVINLFWIGIDPFYSTDSDYNLAFEKATKLSELCQDNQRCELISTYTGNDSLLGNYAGISVFLSTANGNTITFLSKASNYSNERNYYWYHSDIILDMLLGIEYMEGKYPIWGYEIIDQYEILSKELYLMRNNNALSLGYLVSNNIKDYTTELEGILFLEQLLQVMEDSDTSYLIQLPISKISENEYQLIKEEKYPYLYLYFDTVDEINGEELDELITYGDEYGVVYDRYGDTLTFKVKGEKDTLEVYAIDMEAIETFKESRVELVIDENSGNRIAGHVDAFALSTLMTTIPYEKGWTAYVDGKKVTTYEVLDSFLAIDIEEGYHEIVFEYRVSGLILGVVVSLISFISLMIYQVVRIKKGTIFQ